MAVTLLIRLTLKVLISASFLQICCPLLPTLLRQGWQMAFSANGHPIPISKSYFFPADAFLE